MARVLITGITGQDGSYLADQLVDAGDEVFGLVRRTSSDQPWRLAHLEGRVTLIEGDLLDQASLIRAVGDAQPDEIYNLAAQSFVGRSWREPVHTAEVTGLGALRVLEAVRLARPEAKVYQASTSEMFGDVPASRITSGGPFRPRSPYGSAKLFAHTSAINYRESYDMFVCTGILFNHESPRRGPEFVTRKIAMAAARASLGDPTPVQLGNLDARRDWGWAPDFVDGMVRMMRHPEPLDLVLGTGVSHSVRDLCEAAYGAVGLDWTDHCEVDPKLLRPADIDVLTGSWVEAEQTLGWRPTVSFALMVERMVEAERQRLQSR